MAAISIENLTKTFRRGSVRALDGISLAVEPGEIFGVIGPNGAGKTTLMGCLLGFLRPDGGTITVGGRAPDDLAIRAVTGYLPERLVLDRWMTGRAFLRYHHALAGLPASRRRHEIETALRRVGLGEAAERRIRKYSRGMLQRLGLAQALLGNPRYLFLDEPASGVDPGGVMEVRRLLGELKGKGVTVVLNSHQLEQVERLCDRVAFVRRGKVEAIETVSAGAQEARRLKVRTIVGTSLETSRMEELAARASCRLDMLSPPEACFLVDNDEAAARLLAALVEAGIPIVEARADEGRLERLFVEVEVRPC